MLRHRKVYSHDCGVVWILRTTWCSRRAAHRKEQYREFDLINHRWATSVFSVSEHSVQKASVMALMSKYCWYTVYQKNFANILLRNIAKFICRFLHLKIKCGFMPKSDMKSCPSTTDSFFQVRCATASYWC